MWSLSTTDPHRSLAAAVKAKAGERAPIGVFDSGLGGLTVLSELIRSLPHERFLFLGDSARCPYGPREPEEVRSFVLEICHLLVSRGCKMIVIACNTATAAGLSAAQREFSIPVVGVVTPGARAAVQMTRTRRVGVIATSGTVRQGAYEDAIAHLDAGIKVFQQAAPEFVRIAESRFSGAGEEDGAEGDPQVIAHDYLAPLKEQHIDTLVLGCTHYPLICDLIAAEMGPSVTLVSSAEETAREVRSILERRHDLAGAHEALEVEILVTGDGVDRFAVTAQGLLGLDVTVSSIELSAKM